VRHYLERIQLVGHVANVTRTVGNVTRTMELSTQPKTSKLWQMLGRTTEFFLQLALAFQSVRVMVVRDWVYCPYRPRNKATKPFRCVARLQCGVPCASFVTEDTREHAGDAKCFNVSCATLRQLAVQRYDRRQETPPTPGSVGVWFNGFVWLPWFIKDLYRMSDAGGGRNGGWTYRCADAIADSPTGRGASQMFLQSKMEPTNRRKRSKACGVDT
jgi:hypothetical protein